MNKNCKLFYQLNSLLSNQLMEFYKSINNYQIKKIDEGVLVNDKIKELLIDRISLTYFQKPVFITESKQIYDSDSISKWFTINNTDPLTNVVIDTKQIKVIPVVNYFLALLCLEEKDNELYYHEPFGNIFDILDIAKRIMEGHKPKSGFFSLDLSDYIKDIRKHWRFKEFGKTIEMTIHPIEFEDIIIRCPLSRRQFSDKCIINECGFFRHETIDTPKDYFCYNLRQWIEFPKEPKYIINMEQWFNVFRRERFNKFEIISYFDKSSDPNNTISYMMIDGVDKIDYRKIKMSRLDLSGCFDNISVNNNDWYLSLTSTIDNLYKFYLDNKDNIDIDKKDKLSELLDSNFFNFAFSDNQLWKLKFLFDYPTTFSYEQHTYGADLSFLTLKNKYIRKKCFKMIYFVGSELEDIVFSECFLSCCVFVGCVMKNVTFIDCDLRECKFYKNIQEPIIINKSNSSSQ